MINQTSTGMGGQSELSYRRELEAEIGLLHMKVKNLEFALSQCEKWRNEDFLRFSENEKGRISDLERCQKRCESLQGDLDVALSLADLSKTGQEIPHPFPTK